MYINIFCINDKYSYRPRTYSDYTIHYGMLPHSTLVIMKMTLKIKSTYSIFIQKAMKTIKLSYNNNK